jgi:hypothetical protein
MNKYNQPGLTAEVYALIQEHEALLTKTKGVWQPGELAPIYKIYNAYTGENKLDAGCGACRSNIVNKVRLIHEEYKRTL